MINENEFKAVRDYLKHLAVSWWTTQQREAAICDSCNGTVRRNNGYLIGSNLYCEECFNGSPASMIKRNPDSAGYGTLQNALKFAESSQRSQSNQSSNCYIATKVYGNIDAPQVITLRVWRNNYLNNFMLGRVFVKVYYKIGPVLAKLIISESLVERTIRKVLNSLVLKISKR